MPLLYRFRNMPNIKIQLPNTKIISMKISSRYTMGHLLQRVRTFCDLQPHEGIFLMIQDEDGVESVPPMSMLVRNIGEDCLVKVLKESTFGCFEAEIDEEKNNLKYCYSYIVPCECNDRPKMLHGPVYDQFGKRYKLDQWVKIDIYTGLDGRKKRSTTRCEKCRYKEIGFFLGQYARTNLM